MASPLPSPTCQQPSHSSPPSHCRLPICHDHGVPCHRLCCSCLDKYPLQSSHIWPIWQSSLCLRSTPCTIPPMHLWYIMSIFRLHTNWSFFIRPSQVKLQRRKAHTTSFPLFFPSSHLMKHFTYHLPPPPMQSFPTTWVLVLAGSLFAFIGTLAPFVFICIIFFW